MTEPTSKGPRGSRWSLLAGLEDRAAAFLGVTPTDRAAVMEGMLRRSSADAVGYWLQLVLSMTIATLGLAMNSVAVVIGAMLISPLMQPLIELGVGLATGSLLLSIRAGVRTATSVVVVVLGAAAVTKLLPFHEVTSELAARTSPTMIDLFIAVACALAAVYTTVRQSRDMISAAAGTAIGISLVPPLCAAGYGLGIADHQMLRGALLLFTANFAAITAVTAITVLLLGFGQVHADEIEDDVLTGVSGRPLAHRAARLTQRAVGRRLGVLTRLLIPAVLLGGIMLPLRRALQEVSWQVRVRGQVERVLARVPGAVVRQNLDVRNGSVRVRMFLVGGDAAAKRVATSLRTEIAAIAGREPAIEVIAVPDAATLDALAVQLRTEVSPPTVVAPPPPAPAAAFAAALADAVTARWPTVAGPVVRVRTLMAGAPMTGLEIEVTHLGPALGDAGAALLAQAWTERLELPVVVVDRPLPTAAVVAAADDGATWLGVAAPLIAQTADIAGLHTCVVVPAAPPPAPTAPPRRPSRAAPVAPAPAPTIDVVRGVVADLTRGRADIEVTTGTGWSLELGMSPCRSATAPGP